MYYAVLVCCRVIRRRGVFVVGNTAILGASILQKTLSLRMLSEQIFEDQLSEILPQYQSKKILVAVSGGVDSMVLFHLLKSRVAHLEVAHINYHLRGQDSNDDEVLVRNYCEQNQTPFHIYNVTEKDQKPQGSIQLWARELRYRFFKTVMAEQQLDYLATAHHLNDQLETFIINLSRGSGIKGLAGIPEHRKQIIRPLLHFSKAEIYTYADTHQIPFREDGSNTKNDYLRNFIRNTISPKLLETNPNFLEHFGNSLNYLREASDFIDEEITQKLQQITIKKTSEAWVISKDKLAQLSEFAQYEILKRLGFKAKAEHYKIFEAETGSVFYGNDYQLLINREELILTPISNELTHEDEVLIDVPYSKEIDLKDYISVDFDKSFEWYFDETQLQFPLKLRKQKGGDQFQPIGMKGKKKVAKFFKDEKLSILAKSKMWLLCDASDTILGVAPLRQDGRYAANPKDKNLIIIRL